MAYYSGQAASYQELLTVLVNACVDQGWTWADGILSKAHSFIKIWQSENDGIMINGGSGKNGSNLLNPSPSYCRLGRFGWENTQPTFPMDYSIHILDEPNEVYFITKFSIDFFYWLAFGCNSSVNNWFAASCGAALTGHIGNGATISNYPIWMDNQRTHQCGFFWRNEGYSINFETKFVLFNEEWISPQATPVINNLFNISPNFWNSESLFLQIIPIQFVSASKTRTIFELENSRYVRIDNFEPEQLIEFGNEKWKIYPFYRKDSNSRNGGSQIQHSGTFGWAIRYDGP